MSKKGGFSGSAHPVRVIGLVKCHKNKYPEIKQELFDTTTLLYIKQEFCQDQFAQLHNKPQ